MRTRSSFNLPVVSPPTPSTSNPKRRNRIRSIQPFILKESPIDTMADQRTMAELLRAPTEGYAEAIVVPPIFVEQFELKHTLINMMTSDQFFGLEKDNPHDHIRWFNKITSTIKYKDVPNSAIKLMLFPFSLAGAARRWLEKEPSHFILTWEDLVFKFINEFFPPSRTTNLLNEISNFQQRFDESFHEAWDRYKDLLLACPHHGFPELHQLDTFYNALNPADPDSLNAAAGGNMLERLKSCDAISNSSSEIAKLTHAVNQQTSVVTTAMTAILKQFQATLPRTSIKAVEEICVTCGGAHPYYQCLAVGGNTFPELRDNSQGYVSAAAVNYNQGNSVYRPPRMANQIRPSGFAQPNKTVANPKGELKAITTRSGIVLDGPSVPSPPSFINPEVDERVEETLMDQDLAEYTIKVPPLPVQKYKPPSQIDFVVHQRDPLHLNIPYPLRILKQKQQEKDKVQIHKFWQMFKQLHINITLADALILMHKYHKMIEALLSNKEKLQELANTPFNENCTTVIVKKLPEKLRDPEKFLIPCGFNELKCKALAELGTSINLMPLSVWKKLGLPELISTRMTLELANRAICTPTRILRDVFVPVGKFTFPADFVIVNYESDLRVPLILRRPFLQTARALIDVHRKKMILRDDFLEDLFSTNQPRGNPTFSSHPELTSSKVKDEIFYPEGGNVLPEKLLDLDSTKDLHPPHHVNPLSGNTTYSFSPNQLLKEFTDELVFITFPLEYDDDLYNLDDLADNLVDSMPGMFTVEHALDYSPPPLFDEYDDDLFEVESDTENFYDDPFDSKGEKIKESKLLIDELDLPCDFLPTEYDSFISEDFSKVDALPTTNNEDKLAISHASLVIEDVDPPLYELPLFKEVPRSKMLLLFSSENKEKVFKPGIHKSEKVHSSLIPELSHQGYKVFKINQIFRSQMKIFLFSRGKDTHILAVSCLHF
nr:reverse transcriptase domain-containing protein [Tanacetum cinerariifolium]